MIPERTALLAAAAVVLLAALTASPAAARDVAAGSTIFVGEENLNLTAIDGTPAATLVYYSTVVPVTIGRTISVGDSGAFDLTAADVGTSVGMWYVFPVGAALEDPGAAVGYVIVQAPDIEPDAEVTGTVSAGTLGIVANKDSVFRGNNFVVTVTGEPGATYYLYVKDIGGLAPGQYPSIPAGQPGVNLVDSAPTGSPTRANVTMNAAGSRSIQFNTNQSTGEWRFTIHVEDPADTTVYDDARVLVEKGAVTAMVSGTGVYYMGEEITLSGTNTDSDITYLSVTGPNLASNGVSLTNFGVKAVNDNPATFTCVDVETDDTWSFKWSTADVGRYIDAGGYTIYAVSQPRNEVALSDVPYDTISIQLRSPYVTATASTVTVTKGGNLTISGTALGNPDNVYVWIFGKNYGVYQLPVAVESDSRFEYTLESGDTEDLSSGQYFVVIQHPRFYGPGVTINASGYLQAQGVTPVDLRALSASEATNALIDALDSYYVDDTYTKFTFRVTGECWIQIDPIDDPAYGKTFTVTGTTDYPAGTVLHYWIATEGGNVLVPSGETVVADDGDWSIDLDTTAIGPGAFNLRVTAPDSLASAAAVFDIYDDVTHPAPSTGATYRVERISVDPPLDELAPGEEIALYGTIDTPWTGNQGSLEFSTDLENPVWSCSIDRDWVQIYARSQSAGSLTLTPFELDYEYGEIQVCLTLEGTVPGDGAESPVLLRILERDADGRTLPESEYRVSFTPAGDDPFPPSADNLTLVSGWNFVSVPRPLAAGNDTAAIFAAVDTGGRSALRYNTTAGQWAALAATDRIAPLDGFWIYSARPVAVPLNFSTDLPVPPSERGLAAGWNAVGVTGADPATARDTLYSVNGQWTTLIGFDAGAQAFETAVVNGGSGVYADNRSVYPGRGYWLYMTGPGTLCSLGA